MPPTPLKRAFLSYSHNDEDATFCRHLHSDLFAHGVHAWVDFSRLPVGEAFDARIAKAIEDSEFFLIVLTPQAVASSYVRRELQCALNQRAIAAKPLILPLLLRDCDVPEEIADLSWCDFRSEFERPFSGLVSGITGERAAFDAYQPTTGAQTPYVTSRRDESIAHYNSGVQAFQRGDLKAALREFEAACELDPSNTDAEYNAAAVGYELAMKLDPQVFIEPVIQRYERVLSLRPRDPDALVNLATIYATNDSVLNLERANELLTRATEVAPAYALAWLRLGDLRFRSSGLLAIISAGSGTFTLNRDQVSAVQAAHAHINKALQIDPRLRSHYPAIANIPAIIEGLLKIRR
jgi:tetratricopeptide (TPR) repeat protein